MDAKVTYIALLIIDGAIWAQVVNTIQTLF